MADLASNIAQIDARIEELTASLNPNTSTEGESVELQSLLDSLVRARAELVKMRPRSRVVRSSVEAP